MPRSISLQYKKDLHILFSQIEKLLIEMKKDINKDSKLTLFSKLVELRHRLQCLEINLIQRYLDSQ